jgi:tetratricopeptide (TPR) repeat protein
MNRPVRVAILALGSCWSALATEIDAAVLRVQESIASGDRDGAQVKLAAAMRRWPNSAGLYNLRGILLAMGGDTAGAEQAFRRAVSFDPQLASAWKNLARAYLSDPDSPPPLAEQALEHASQIDPADEATRLELARVLEWRGAFADSLREIEKIRTLKAPLIAGLRAANLAGLNRQAEATHAAQLFSRDMDLSESDALAVFPVLERYLPAAALAIEEELEARKLATELSRQHLAVIYEGVDDFQKARAALEESVRDKPDAGLLLDLARVAYKQKDIDGALGYVAHARDVAPDNAALHFFFGMLAVEKNLPLEARKSLAIAVRLASGNASYNYAMGAVSLQGPDPAEAIPFFERYVALSKGDPRGHFALGVAKFSCSDYAGARRELKPLTANPETAAGAHYFLGRMDKLEENPATAADHFEQSITRNPNFPDAHAELAMLRIRSSDFEGARREIGKALALDPDNAGANRDLLVLYQRLHDPRSATQAARVAELEAKREEKTNLLFRTIEVRPY